MECRLNRNSVVQMFKATTDIGDMLVVYQQSVKIVVERLCV